MSASVREATAGDLEALVDALSDSFREDPLLKWLIPSHDLYSDYFRMLIRDVYTARGIMHIDSAETAGALWLPPDQRMRQPSWSALLRLSAKIYRRNGLAIWRKLRKQSRVVRTHQPREPHYHLQFIGCRQSRQGRGIGSALLAHGTAICDQQGLPAYLESSNRRNLPLYLRHGFEVRSDALLDEEGPRIWFMWREPV